VRIWCHPSFEPDASWALLRHDPDWYVRRVLCKRMDDTADETPRYLTEGAETPIPTERAENLIQSLVRIQIPTFFSGPGGLGMDGTLYGIQCGDVFRTSRMTWWENAPKEWTDVAYWYWDAMKLFERLLPGCGPQFR